MVDELHIGVLALQGAFREHCAALERLWGEGDAGASAAFFVAARRA